MGVDKFFSQTAMDHNVEKQGLVRALLTFALDALEDGNLAPPMAEEQPEPARKLDI